MESLAVIPDVEAEAMFPPVTDARRAPVDVAISAVGGRGDATRDGKPSVMFRIELPDGRQAVAETTLALFLAASEVLRARWGDDR